MSTSVHESAYIDDEAIIGDETKIWHFCHVLAGAVIGQRCSFGQNCFVAAGTIIGNDVKVQNNVSIYEGTTIEDDVFLGPSCVLTNRPNPRSQVVRSSLYERTLLRRGASIGANATIVCGLTIGRYAFVGAGAVVTEDVADYALVLGVPARFAGWMSRHGHRLTETASGEPMVCPESGLRYLEISPGVLRCLDLDEEDELPAELALGKDRYDEIKKSAPGRAAQQEQSAASHEPKIPVTATDPIPAADLGPELREIDAEIEAAWQRVKASRQFILGPEVEAFEREIASFLGVEHAVGVGSGTGALIIALRAQGIGPGDEVITSPFSFVATAEAVRVVGATPVFVDIDPETFCLQPALLPGALSPKTKAVLPVHLFGHAADMAPIVAFAREHGLRVVEDVAQALGGSYQERRLGIFGHASAFSFFPAKNLGCLGDGGLVGTNDAPIAEEARALRAHGVRHSGAIEAVGYNSRLDALQAAFLRAKLPHVEGWNDARRDAAARYRELLHATPGIVLPSERPRVRHVYHQFTIRVTGGRRDPLRGELAARGIETRIYYPRALHELPIFAATRADCPEAEAACREVLSLPIWPRISAEAQRRVASEIQRALERL